MEAPKELRWRGAPVLVLRPTTDAALQEALAATLEGPVALVVPVQCERWLESAATSHCVAVFSGSLSSEEQAVAASALAAETVYVSPSLAGALLLSWRRAAQSAQIIQRLTLRERDIMTLLVQGRSNREIAGLLFLSPHTVRNHLSRIFAKLDISTRAEASDIWRLANPGAPMRGAAQSD